MDFARAGRMVAGGALVIAGTAMMVLPGPGILTVLAGLTVLEHDVPVAHRALAAFRRRFGSIGGVRPAVASPAPAEATPTALPGPAGEGVWPKR